MSISNKMLAAGAAVFKRYHSDTCYPDASDWEAREAATAIYVAMQKVYLLAPRIEARSDATTKIDAAAGESRTGAQKGSA